MLYSKCQKFLLRSYVPHFARFESGLYFATYKQSLLTTSLTKFYSAFPQPISASAAYILCEVCRDKYDAVLPLVRLLLHHHKLVPFVAAVAELDLKDTQYVFHV